MKKKKILILGGGVAGCSAAYFLKKKNYQVTILEKNGYVGGTARTHYYAGHPYEFGPHIWFWPHDDINDVVRELTRNELYYITRPLRSFVEKDRLFYRYPLHFDDISSMPDKDVILKQLKKNRDKNFKLIEKKMPVIGQCTFEEYFVAALGHNLYDKIMNNYSHKMWNIPGDKLKTSMVWADRVKHDAEKLKGYDPLKFGSQPLGSGIQFQVYPKKGWNVVWEGMAKGAKVRFGVMIDRIQRQGGRHVLVTNKGAFRFEDYDAVISTISIDELWGEDTLPYTGRIVLPLLFPRRSILFPDRIESVYYPGTEFQTRVTEMKKVTKYKSKDSLIIIEVPILPGAKNAFPENVMQEQHIKFKAYPQQSEQALAQYEEYARKSSRINNLFLLGRLAQFRYWGMPETVNAAYKLVNEHF